MSSLIRVELPPADYPLPTVLPVVGEGNFDYASLLLQAFTSETYRPFVTLGYLHFNLRASYPVGRLKSPPEVMSFCGEVGRRMVSVKREVGPSHLGLAVLVNIEETVGSLEMHELHAIHVGDEIRYFSSSVLPRERLEVGHEDEELVSVSGFASVDELEGCPSAYKLSGKTSLQQMVECGEVVQSSVDTAGNPFD
jgi:hypothetical protein